MDNQFPESEEEQESAEHRQKRYEQLHAYAKAAYDQEIKRMDDAEAKAARLFPLIVLLLGVGSVGIKDAVNSFWQFKSNNLCYLIPYAFFYITCIGSIIAFLWTLRIQKLPSPSIDKEVIHYFENKYLDILYSYSDEFLSYAQGISKRVNIKYIALKCAYWLLGISVLLALLSTIGYVVSLSPERVGMRLERPASSSPPPKQSPAYVKPPPARQIDKGDKTAPPKTGKN